MSLLEPRAADLTGRAGATKYGPFDLRWYESGDPDGPPVLLLHGLYAGAHSYEWRRLTPHLSAEALVRVPDLLGAGASDRPALDYTTEVVQGAVDALIDDAPEGCHVVASSLTGAYALRSVAAGRKVGSLTLITPSGMGSPREADRAARSRRLYDAVRSSPAGALLVRALTSERSVRWFQQNKTYRDPAALTAEEVSETRRAGRLPGAKHLQLAFVFDRLSIDVDPADVRTVSPAVLWARGQQFVDASERDAWAAAGARVVDVDAGLPQVENPEYVAGLVLGTARVWGSR